MQVHEPVLEHTFLVSPDVGFNDHDRVEARLFGLWCGQKIQKVSILHMRNHLHLQMRASPQIDCFNLCNLTRRR